MSTAVTDFGGQIVRLVGYLRVSGERQVTHREGLTVQRQAVRKWAAANGHRIVKWSVEEGVTGKSDPGERITLPEALALVSAGKADGIAVHKIDRLARQLTTQGCILATIWAAGGRVYSVEAGEILQDDPDDPMRTSMRQMMGVFAELERATINARLRAGKRVKAANGGYVGGTPRYGQAVRDRQYTPDPGEQAALPRMRELNRDGRSLRQICDVLAAESHRPKRGDRWHPTTVSRCLARAASQV